MDKNHLSQSLKVLFLVMSFFLVIGFISAAGSYVEVGTLNYNEVKNVGANKNCVAFPYEGEICGKNPLPLIDCRYDSASGNILGSNSNVGNTCYSGSASKVKCGYICSSEEVDKEITTGSIGRIYDDQKVVTKFIGKNKNCVGVVSNIHRSDRELQFSCTYNSNTGNVTGTANGGTYPGSVYGDPWVECDYFCYGDEVSFPQEVEKYNFGNGLDNDIGSDKNCISFLSSIIFNNYGYWSNCEYNSLTGLAFGGPLNGVGNSLNGKCGYICSNDCTSGSCAECKIDSDCGENSYSDNFCDGGDVYRNHHVYGCSSGSCEEEIRKEKVENCEYGCGNGVCQNLDLTECEDSVDNDFDGLIDSKDPGCWSNSSDSTTYNSNLDDESRYDVKCNTNCDCGSTIHGNSVCQGKSVFKEILQKLCQNHGTGASFCTLNPVIVDLVFVNECDYGCKNGACYGECNVKSDCGGETLGGKYCGSDNDLYQLFNGFDCESFMCEDKVRSQKVEDCGNSDYGIKSNTYCIGNGVYFNQTFYDRGCAVDKCFVTAGAVEQVKEAECSQGCSGGKCSNVDVKGPVIALISPLNGSTEHDEVEFSFNVSDEATVRNCSFFINGDSKGVLNNVLKNVTNKILFTPNVGGVSYSWFIGCFDIYNNYGVSEKRAFYYMDGYCEGASDCDVGSEDLICQGDSVVKEVVLPLCQLNNTCAYNVSYEFVRNCPDRCLNGICLSDSDRNTYDDNYTSLNVNNYNPYSGSGSGSSGGGSGGNILLVSSALGSSRNVSNFMDGVGGVLGGVNIKDTGKGDNKWLFVILLLLLVGILFLILLIFWVWKR